MSLFSLDSSQFIWIIIIKIKRKISSSNNSEVLPKETLDRLKDEILKTDYIDLVESETEKKEEDIFQVKTTFFLIVNICWGCNLLRPLGKAVRIARICNDKDTNQNETLQMFWWLNVHF